MLKTQVQDLAIPRASLEKPRRSVSLPLPSPVDVNGFSRKSCSYSKLPEEPIKLTVQKLDGSSFDVEVIRSATIAELKLAVQHVFSHMPKNGPGKISWPHVWGHFCLCYDGLELLTETDHMMNYGIKDGDQLHFIRHASSGYNLTKIQSKKRMVAHKQSYLSMQSSTCTLGIEQSSEEDDNDDNIDGGRCKARNGKKQSMIVQQECQFGHLWRGWSSHSRRKGSSKGRVCQRRESPSFVGNCRKLFQLWGTAKYSPKR
ncbi:Nucleotide/sugar transporter family protein isoform 1 [Hibiscus syriacus]|uniref:Nucleotide/sugar transporter family protein isoform 1 n=1 Tax=Hibiscus syriacus TaxID=106335 RepID=A0A6A2YNR5_HIBSY|nr:Nucleotide/sugar transporter family protein isoform 1 [Hibiscus syriacus]